MPAFSTHYLFAEEMLDFANEIADFNLIPSAVYIGAQGPDVFFFHRLATPTKSKAKAGRALHHSKPSEIIDAFCDYCAFSPNIDVAKSYMFGFIMHYALDRNLHPYVYALQDKICENNKKINPASAHDKIEHSMDTYLLCTKLGIDNPADFSNAQTIKADYSVIEEIGHLLAFVVPRVTGIAVSEKDAKTAVSDTRIMQNVLRDKTGGFVIFCHLLEHALAKITKYYKFSAHVNPKDLEKAKKYANINNNRWHSPYEPDVDRYESYLDLFKESKDDCINLLNGFMLAMKGGSNGREVTQNISFLTGLEV